MDNRRIFARVDCHLPVIVSHSGEKCVGEIQNIGLGGLQARVARGAFEAGDIIEVSPQDQQPLRYEVRWQRPSGGGVELGLRFPDSIAGFWESWAADLLAGQEPTNSEVMERRRQIRLACSLNGFLKVKRKQFKGKVLDLGTGGALVELDHSLKEGANLQLTIKDPVRVGHVPCQVVRVFPGAVTRYGLSFVTLKERHRLAVVRLLDLLVRHS